MIPPRPDGVVDAEEYSHMLLSIKFHYLHCPEGKHIFFMEEDSSFLWMLNPLNDIHECGRPLIGYLRRVHRPPGYVGYEAHPGLWTEVGLVSTSRLAIMAVDILLQEPVSLYLSQCNLCSWYLQQDTANMC